jgi:hypothetical protein
MGSTLHDLDDLPEIHDIIWCNWPYRQHPGVDNPVRPVLVRARDIRQNFEGLKFGILSVAYGTSSFKNYTPKTSLFVDSSCCRRLGLHKPTRFSLDPQDSRLFLWSAENFLPQNYVSNSGIVLGRLDDDHIEKLNRCLSGLA